MKRALLFLFGVALGCAASFVWSSWSPHEPRLVYSGTRDLALTDRDGKVVGRIPKGTPLLSAVELQPTADLGWWGYVPVYLGGIEDERLIARSPEKPSKTEMLNGRSADEIAIAQGMVR